MADGCRWLARLLALLGALMVLAFALGEHHASATVSAAQLALLGLFGAALIGNLAAWRWELGGATLALISALLFGSIEVVRNHRLPGPWILGVMAVPALLHACSWLLRPRSSA